MNEDPAGSVRMSVNQIRANPVLASQRDFCLGIGRRNQEQRQLRRLEKLQAEGVAIHSIPRMIRVDSSSLTISKERIGPVGLVVDNDGEGYVTRLRVQPSNVWEVSPDLPFHQVHIQSLLLRVLGDLGLDDGLPELMAFRIFDTLGERCEGDSMDIACLLAIVDASTNHETELLSAAAAVVSPASNDLLESSKSVVAKLNAFKREFGRGSLLVRHTNDKQAATFDSNFNQVWPVRNLSELASRLIDCHGALEKGPPVGASGPF